MTCVSSEDSNQPGDTPSLISLRCLPEEILGPWLPTERKANTRVFAERTCHVVGFVMRRLKWFWTFVKQVYVAIVER